MQRDRLKGILCLLASAAGFAVMAMFVRLCDDCGGPVSSFQKSFFRNLVALALAAVVFVRGRRAPCARPRPGQSRAIPQADGRARVPGARAWLFLLGRSVFGCMGIFANFYALSKIPIGEAMALNKTAPFFTVAFSWAFLREKAGPRQLVCLAVAFAGVLLVMKPGFAGSASFATLCALGGGLGAGIAYTFVREMGILGVSSAFIVLFFSLFSCLASVPFMAGDFCPMTPAQVLVMLGAGAGAAVGQFGVTAAYRFAPPKEISVYDYSSILFAAALGFAFFGQVPDLMSVAGFALIVAAAWKVG